MALTHIAPVELTTSLVTIHTVPSLVQATLIELWSLNRDSSNRLVTYHFVPNGGSPTAANMVVELQSGNALRPGEDFVREYSVHLGVGYTIQVKADANSQVTMWGGVTEELV